MRKISSVYGLVNAYYEKHPNGHFFDPNTLKFFGERFSEMRLLEQTETVTDVCYVLSSLQRKHPMGPRRKYTFFDVETLDDVIV